MRGLTNPQSDHQEWEGGTIKVVGSLAAVESSIHTKNPQKNNNVTGYSFLFANLHIVHT